MGVDPGTAATLVATVELIPVTLVFPDGTTLDPTAPTCKSASSALLLTINSPLFPDACSGKLNIRAT
jgi:hypothetical protein